MWVACRLVVTDDGQLQCRKLCSASLQHAPMSGLYGGSIVRMYWWHGSQCRCSCPNCVCDLQAHPVTGGPSFMLHPCQTAARMQLLIQPDEADSRTRATLAAGDAPPSWTAAPAAVATAAVTPAAHPGPPRQHGCCASGVASHTARPQLLVYAQGWFSMIVPLLGLSLRSCSPGTESERHDVLRD